jgi:hypothetical protein
MDITLKTTTYGGAVNILDSANVRYVRGGVTLDAAQVAADGNGIKKLLAGTFIGVTGGKYRKYIAATLATLATGVVADNNAITWTAKPAYAGTAGHAIKVSLIDPGGNSKPLEVLIVNNEVRVMLATSGAGAITSTAAQVIAAVNTAIGNSFVSAASTGVSTGAAAVVAAAAAALANGANANIVPTLILGEDVDFTSFTQSSGLAYADRVVTAIDQARIISARLPAAPDDYVKASMPGISFV